MWQTTPGKQWRLNPDRIYGIEITDSSLAGNVEPWAGDEGTRGLRPWAPPENWKEVKTYKDQSIVTPPRYDTNL